MTIADLYKLFLDFNNNTTLVIMDYYELNTTTFPSYPQLKNAYPDIANSEIYWFTFDGSDNLIRIKLKNKTHNLNPTNA